MRGYLLLSGVLFSVIAVVHVLRLIYGWPVVVAELNLPLWLSGVGLLITGALAVWAFVNLSRLKPAA